MLRDDALKAELAGMLEHGHADLALHMLIVLDAVACFGQQLGKPGLAGVERVGAYIVTSDCQQIERQQPSALRLPQMQSVNSATPPWPRMTASPSMTMASTISG
jgi:hypothetical protein